MIYLNIDCNFIDFTTYLYRTYLHHYKNKEVHNNVLVVKCVWDLLFFSKVEWNVSFTNEFYATGLQKSLKWI